MKQSNAQFNDHPAQSKAADGAADFIINNMLETVMFPTGRTESDAHALAHAAALAGSAGSCLTTLHVGDSNDPEGSRKDYELTHLLKSWSECDDSPASSLKALEITRAALHPKRQLARQLRRSQPSLLVVGTHQYKRHSPFLFTSLAEDLSRESEAPTLFVPQRARGFVDMSSGGVELSRVVVVNDGSVDGASLMCHSVNFFNGLNLPQFPAITYLDLAETRDDYAESHPTSDRFRIRTEPSSRVTRLLEAVGETDPDLIVTPHTAQFGTDGLFHIAISEQLIRNADVPVLALPSQMMGHLSTKAGPAWPNEAPAMHLRVAF